MKYFFAKYKFSDKLFYNKIQTASLNQTKNYFEFEIVPFFEYSGKYFIHSVHQKDRRRTVYTTMKNIYGEDLKYINPANTFYVSLSHNGKKAMIFTSDMEGIILKS